MVEFPKIKTVVQRDMQSLCSLCGEDINSKPAGPHGLVHVDCMEAWAAQARLKDWKPNE